MGYANEGSPPCETACVLYLSHLQPLILRITHSEQGCVRRKKKKSALHHCTSLSMELLEDAEPFLCLDTVLFLLIEILSSEREQWCTPILFYYSPLCGQIGPCLDSSCPTLQLCGFLLFLGFPFIDFFNLPLIHLFIVRPSVTGQQTAGSLTLLQQRHWQDQPAIIVITVPAYIGLLCFVPHLPSSAGSLSSNLPVIANSRRGSRRSNAIREGEKSGNVVKEGWLMAKIESKIEPSAPPF